MKNQALFSSKYNSKKLKCCLLQFLFGALRVKSINIRLKQTDIVNVLCYFSGGFAFVFVAQDNTSGKEYALKVCVLR